MDVEGKIMTKEPVTAEPTERDVEIARLRESMQSSPSAVERGGSLVQLRRIYAMTDQQYRESPNGRPASPVEQTG
jgi:hypothetical protein